VNGTLAERLKGFNADAVILSEPSFCGFVPHKEEDSRAHVMLKLRWWDPTRRCGSDARN
jgi:hypothetical protein